MDNRDYLAMNKIKPVMIIKVTDLRIGNTILFGDKIDNVTEVCETVCNGEHHHLYHYDKLHPIPLTPEILQKAGFVQKGGYGIYEAHDKSLYEWYGDDLFYRHRGTRLSTPVKHLHQLQNLVHSLTGEELEIKW
jgi:hypothetical protein